MASPKAPLDPHPRTRHELDEERRRVEKQRRIYSLGMMDLTRGPNNLPAAVGDWRQSWRKVTDLSARWRLLIYARDCPELCVFGVI